MALVLALNPGNRHSPTLSRLARELRGCELMGAESCPVAIKAIKKRVPDVLLLPATPTPGEAELMTHLKTIPGGVLTLKLPPVESADPVDLARQIRELLTGVPASAPPAAAKIKTPAAPAKAQAAPPAAKVQPPPQPPPALEVVVAPPGASPQLLAAASATVEWIHTRQRQWSEPWVEAPREPLAANEPEEQEDTYYEPIELPEGEPDPFALEAAPEEDTRSNAASLLPRVAAIAAVVVVLGGAMAFWPQMRRMFGGSEAPAQTTSEPPAAAAPEPVAAQPAPAPPAEPAAPMDTATGTVAIVLPFEITITESDKPVTLDDQRRAVLPPGKHRLRFQNAERGYDATRTVQVRPNETTTLTLTPETTLAITSNEPAEVLVDGVRVGETPYEGKLGLGPHTVTVKTSGAERQLPVDATSKPVQLEVDFSKP